MVTLMTPIPNPIGFLAFFNLGTSEILVVVFLAFLLFGAKKIPELMRSLGRAQGEFQHAKKAFDAEVAGTDKPAAPTTSEADRARAAVESTAGTTTATVEDAALAGARAEAKALGIDTEGKDMETLRKEIKAKRPL